MSSVIKYGSDRFILAMDTADHKFMQGLMVLVQMFSETSGASAEKN